MSDSRWIVGISGGIAAYKTAELVRLLKKNGDDVRVVLSQGAESFVTPMTLQAVSGHPVYQALFDSEFEAAMGHIELARWATGIVIAPITANRMAALAHGLADDLLTTLCLASKAPLWIAPAMNQHMWHHSATQANRAILKARGVNILEPAAGEQACGDVGIGRMQEPQDIFEQLCKPKQALSFLANKRIVITAGPTQEPIDAVRFISNRSSGKMGFALATAAAHLGAQVTLISGPVALDAPKDVHVIKVVTAEQMKQAVFSCLSQCDIFISAAAVADFKVDSPSQQKLKKTQTNFFEQLKWVPNPDILTEVSTHSKRPYCVGFAAETTQGAEYAKQKLVSKNLDLIALNNVFNPDIGFDSDNNALTVFNRFEQIEIAKAPKYQIAEQLLQIISQNYEKNKIKNS